jgi:hypothetical protein
VAQESGYTAGNKTERLVEIANKVGNGVDLATQLSFGGEAVKSLGRIVFRTTKDVVRKDPVCTRLCLISCACETVAIDCSTVKIISYRGKIYLAAKLVSQGCMIYRNLYADDGC